MKFPLVHPHQFEARNPSSLNDPEKSSSVHFWLIRALNMAYVGLVPKIP